MNKLEKLQTQAKKLQAKAEKLQKQIEKAEKQQPLKLSKTKGSWLRTIKLNGLVLTISVAPEGSDTARWLDKKVAKKRLPHLSLAEQLFPARKKGQPRYVTHCRMISPNGQEYLINNLTDFVDKHRYLFEQTDLIPIRGDNVNDSPARIRLSFLLKQYRGGEKDAEWKGWKVLQDDTYTIKEPVYSRWHHGRFASKEVRTIS